jgi:hypothetical protein
MRATGKGKALVMTRLGEPDSPAQHHARHLELALGSDI